MLSQEFYRGRPANIDFKLFLNIGRRWKTDPILVEDWRLNQISQLILGWLVVAVLEAAAKMASPNAQLHHNRCIRRLRKLK